MEVYATIFMIFVSHVLSSFTPTFTSRQKDGRHISIQPLTRRMVYFKNHYNDEENQRGTVLKHVMPFINGDREQSANGDYDRNTQYGEDEMVRVKIPDVYSPRESIQIMDSMNYLRSPREEKPSDASNQNVLSSTFTTENSFHSSTVNSEVVLKKLDGSKTNITSNQSSAIEAWENRAKLKFITVRPWNQFCLTCDDTPNKLKEDCVRASPSYHTKRKKTHTHPFSRVKSTTTLNQPWLFFAGHIKTRKPIDKCSKSVNGCKNKLRSPDLKVERNNHIKILNFIRSKNKERNNFLLSKSQLGILKSALKRNKKDINQNGLISYVLPLTNLKLMNGGINIAGKKKLSPLGKNIYHNNLLMNKLKRRSLNLIENENDSNLVGFISLGRRNKNHNFDKGIPPCQNSSTYNFTGLLNAQTIRPLEYFRRKPSLLLCGEDEVSIGAGASNITRGIIASEVTSAVDSVTNQINSPLQEDLSMSPTNTDSSSVPDVSSKVSGDWQFGLTGSYPDPDNLTANNSNSPDTNFDMSTVPDPGTIPTVFQMFMDLRAASTDKSISEEPKGICNLQVALNNKDELINLNGEKLELKSENIPEPLYYLISFKSNDTFEDSPNIINMMKTGGLKKIQPWDKFCPCSGGKLSTISNGDADVNRQPWLSACVGCISTIEDNAVNILGADLDPVSTVKSDDSVLQIMSKPLEEEDLKDLNTKHSRPDRKPLLLIRVPISEAQEYSRKTATTSRKTNTKHIKPRSILDIFMPSLLKKTTMRPLEHVLKPWEEPWKYRPEKFSLFTTSEYPMYDPGKDIINPSSTTIEYPLASKSLLDYIAETCPSCSKNRKDSFLKTKDKHYDEIETTDELFNVDICYDNSTCNELTNETCDLKYISDILKLPDFDLIEVSSPAPKKVKSLKGLTILQSQGSPPKYFIEVPELWTGLKNIALGGHTTSLPSITLKKKSTTHPEKAKNVSRKKLTILCLQPFDINGNNVYLPMSDLDIDVKEESSTSVGNDREEHTSNPRRKTIMHGFIEKNDSALPFVLVPAYLAMHPQTKTPSHYFLDTDHLTSVNVDRKISLSDVSGNSKIKDKDVEQLNNISLEKKSNTVHKELYTSITPVNIIGLTKKASRKPLFGKSSFPSRRPSLVILLNGIGPQLLNSPELPLDKGDFSFMDQKDGITIGPIEDYLLI